MTASTATRGRVTGADARDGVLTLTFEGDIELDELRAMLNAFLPTVRNTFAAVRVVTPDGSVLANLKRDD